MRRGVLLLLVLLVACGGGDDDTGATGPATTSAASEDALLQDSWMHHVAADLARLGPFEGATGDAWLGFYHNDLRSALTPFEQACTPSAAPLGERAATGYPCIGAARTHLELAALYAGAAEVGRVAWRQFHKHRSEHRDEVLPSVHGDYFGGVVLLHSGDREGGLERLNAYVAAEGGDELLDALAQKIVEGLVNGDPLVGRIWGGEPADATDHPGLGELPSSPETAGYAARLTFIEAVARGDLETAQANIRIDPNLADLEETLEQQEGEAPAIDPVIRHADPAYLQAMSRFHAHRALVAAGGAEDLQLLTAQAERLLGRDPAFPEVAPALNDGLALVVFSAHPTPADLLAAERAHPTAVATIRRLGAATAVLGTAPSAQLADLDPFIDGSNQVTLRLGELLSAAGAHGANLDADMGLSERFRSHVLQERAVQFTQSFSVHLDETEGADMAGPGVAVRSLLELAMDKNPSPPNQRLKDARISYVNDPPLLARLARAELDTRRPGLANDYIRPMTSIYPELISVRDALTILDTAWNPPREGGGVKQGN